MLRISRQWRFHKFVIDHWRSQIQGGLMTKPYSFQAFFRLIFVSIVVTTMLVTALVTAAPVAVATPPTYSGGIGTSEDPFQISTAADWTTLMSATQDWDNFFILTADIDFDDAYLTPVGNSSTQFTGSFSGNGHVLENANINQGSSSYIGVFGYAGTSANITYLGAVNASMNGRYCVGGLVGYNQGTIIGCYTTGTVTSSGDYMMGGYCIGGLVGYNYHGTITDSYSTGAVTTSGGFDIMEEGNTDVGGLVGYNYQGIITRCFATGAVTANSTDNHYYYESGYQTGGLVGFTYMGSITDCYATGTVSGYYEVGGLLGCAYSAEVTHCYSTGLVNGTSNVGGLVGYISSVTTTASYWDNVTSGQASSAAGEGRSTDSMTYPYDADTYVGWDFSTTWVADTANNNGGYPYLYWQPFNPVPEIDIQGNSVSITSGDTTPATADYTDFGEVGVSIGNLTHAFIIRNTGSANLTLSGEPKVSVQGTDAADFVITTQPISPVVGGSSTTFDVNFSPGVTGLRTATISIANDDSNENPYTFTIQGTGKASLTVTGITTSDKIYDGTNVAAINSASPALVGVLSGDNVSLVIDSLTGAFDNKTIGNNKTVTVSGLSLSGTDAGNYLLVLPDLTADITAKGLTVTGITADNKTYDGTLSAQIHTDNATLIGVIDNDTVTLNVASAAGTFNNANPGDGKTVTVSGLVLEGTDAGNYTLTQPTTTADITAPEMAITGNSVVVANGDSTPSTTDYTDFGSLNVGDSRTLTYFILNNGRETLDLTGDPIVSIGGTNSADFTVIAQLYSTLVSGNTTSFQITFTPGAAGTRTATISIAGNDPINNPYVFTIQGTGASAPVTGEVYVPPVTSTTTPTPTPTTLPPTTVPPTTVPPTTSAIHLIVDVKGGTGTATIETDGTVKGTITVNSPDSDITLTIPDGTRVLVGSCVPTRITIMPDNDPPAPPTDQNIIGIPYECLPEGITFNPPVTLTWTYDPAALPEGTDPTRLQVAYFNPATQQWEAVTSVVDPTTHTIKATISHFSTYAVIAPATTNTTPLPTAATTTDSTGVNIGLIIGIIAAVIVVVAIVILLARRKKNPTAS
jgi:hypothetical protein